MRPRHVEIRAHCRTAAPARFSGVHARGDAALDAGTRNLGFDLFNKLIQIHTTDSVGHTTTAAKAMAQHLLDAGFAPEGVVVAGPNEPKGNLGLRYPGKGKL